MTLSIVLTTLLLIEYGLVYIVTYKQSLSVIFFKWLLCILPNWVDGQTHLSFTNSSYISCIHFDLEHCCEWAQGKVYLCSRPEILFQWTFRINYKSRILISYVRNPIPQHPKLDKSSYTDNVFSIPYVIDLLFILINLMQNPSLECSSGNPIITIRPI